MDVGSSQTLIAAGPFLRYYIPISDALLYFEGKGAIGRLTVGIADGDDEMSSTSNMSYKGVGIGISAPLSRRGNAMLDVGLELGSTVIKFPEEDLPSGFEDSNYRTVSTVVGLNVGFSIFLGQ